MGRLMTRIIFRSIMIVNERPFVELYLEPDLLPVVEQPGPGRLDAELLRGDFGKPFSSSRWSRGRDCSWEA
jgi:hypothetical protein